MSAKESTQKNGGEKLIASNPARGDYIIHEVVEAGMVLKGTEVKSLRQSSPNLRDAYVEVRADRGGKDLEAWIYNLHIGPYSHGNLANHEPTRKRKLLLHRHQINQIHGSLIRDGMTAVATKMYFKGGIVKVEIGVGKGKKRGDKREDMKRKTADREMSKAMKKSSRSRDR